MTIRKGQPWGETGTAPFDTPLAGGDGELAALVERARADGDLSPVFRVSGGDLAATVGVTPSSKAGGQLLPVDLGHIRLDSGHEFAFVAHVLIHRRLWRGLGVAIMNAAWFGSWYLGPRAHPNDGLLDVTVGKLGWRDRLEARRRVVSGAHLPHPELKTVRVSSWDFAFGKPMPILVDGTLVGRSRSVSVRLESDAFILAT